jgi:hypothetical protein
MNATTNQSKPARDHYGWTQTDENNRREVDRALAELERRSVAVVVPEQLLEKWQRSWRDAVAPKLSAAGLLALQKALVEDDPALIQEETVGWQDKNGEVPVSACAIGYAGWKGDGLKTSEDIVNFFSTFGKGCHDFLEWFDDALREEMRLALLPEVKRAIASRNAAGPPPAPKPEDADDEPPDKDATPILPDDDIPAEPDDYVPPPSHGQHERQQQRAREATRQAVGVPVVSESEGVILP